MKYILPLVVASFMLAIVTAMLEEGPLPLPFLIGYLLGIVVPVVVFTGILTLVVAGIYRVYTRKELSNLFAVMWSIWVLVAVVNFYGNYQNIKGKQAEQARQSADPYTKWGQENKLPQWQHAEDEQGRPPAVLSLQARFAEDSRQLDAELAREVAAVQIPPLFDPVFLEDKSRFPAAMEQLENYAQLFQEHKDRRMEMLLQKKAEIEQLDLPQNEILQAVHEFNNTYELDEELSRKYFDIVIEVSRQGIALLDYMDRAHYSVSNGRIMFETDTESEKYQEFLQIFKRLSKQEVATQRELAESREKRMEYLLELAR